MSNYEITPEHEQLFAEIIAVRRELKKNADYDKDYFNYDLDYMSRLIKDLHQEKSALELIEKFKNSENTQEKSIEWLKDRATETFGESEGIKHGPDGNEIIRLF